MIVAAEQRSDLVTRLAASLGQEGIITDPEECRFYAQDIFTNGPQPLAVVRPDSAQTLARAVAAATAEGVVIIPRGGGMSYTGGYVAPSPGALIVDLGRMQRIIEINESDMTATVEAGCTWDALHLALKPRGLRALAWGTLSGIKASIGGGMSQNGIFWGARNGTVVDGALSFEVVLADGRIVTTGSRFFRPFGPDVTGLFAADTGALGIKTKVTLQLVREAEAFAYGSYAFDTAAQFMAAMSEVARQGLASECFGFDPFLQSQRMKRDSLASDAKSLLNMMKAQGSAWQALREGAKVVTAGRSFLDDVPFSMHVICEGRHQAGVDADLAIVARFAHAEAGRTIENSIPKILRANPFPPVNSMVGPSGERWVPVHGFVPHSRLQACWDRIQALFSGERDEMERLGVGAGAMFAAVSPSACLIEPVFFWPDALEELHRRSLEPGHLAKLKQFPANAAARLLVERLRQQVVAVFGEMEATHLQIGRTYLLCRSHDESAWSILRTVKEAVDPKGLMNPGSLGL
jgi:FAD/FMN-containing dehydrogenase